MKPQTRAHCAAAGLLLSGAFLYSFAPAEHTFYPRCIFHALTGLQCPGCGGTRALYHLLHLNLGQAMHYNALVTMLAPFLLGYFVFWYCAVLRTGQGPRLSFSRPVMVAMYVTVILFAVVRNLAFFS
ncbi:MAG TPA: DUF2752 domain-containing protein [Candidatus Angelobacter sp.]